MYSLATRTTLAALTIASAASIEPMSPRVSTSPSASCDMQPPQRRDCNIIAGAQQRRYHDPARLRPGRFGPGPTLSTRLRPDALVRAYEVHPSGLGRALLCRPAC